MILLWFISAIALAFAIARYNESNKLFWTLAIAFLMGFAGAKMVFNNTSSNEKGNSNLTQVCPTQTPMDASATTLFQVAANMAATKVTDSNSVSKVYTPEPSEISIAPSEVFGRTRDQPLTLIKPPELCLVKNFSTLHDTG